MSTTRDIDILKQIAQPKEPIGWILIVDDNQMSLYIRSKKFINFGYTVDTAIDGEDAIDMIKSNLNKYDIILMNFLMPRINGIRATHTIRKLGYIRPILGFSAGLFKFDENYEAGKKAGMDECLDSEEQIVFNHAIEYLEKLKENKKSTYNLHNREFFRRLFLSMS